MFLSLPYIIYQRNEKKEIVLFVYTSTGNINIIQTQESCLLCTPSVTSGWTFLKSILIADSGHFDLPKAPVAFKWLAK